MFRLVSAGLLLAASVLAGCAQRSACVGGGGVNSSPVTPLPADVRAELDEYLEVHEWLLLHVILDGETELPEGPRATALLRAAYDPDAGVLRFGGRGR